MDKRIQHKHQLNIYVNKARDFSQVDCKDHEILQFLFYESGMLYLPLILVY